MVTTTFCNSGAALVKAGDGVATITHHEGSDFIIDIWINQAESLINTVCRYNFTDGYASLNTDVKYILNDIASSLAAIYCIIYDMSGYNSRIEAEDMINVLRDSALRGLSLLRDKKAQEFLNDA